MSGTVKADRTWLKLAVLCWFAIAIGLLIWRKDGIYWFALGDTDDNMRLMQVRAWLAGQDWFDLRQYRLQPPMGADIHWSRLVDLPIAGIILLLRPFMGAQAEYVAVAAAPLLPMLVLLVALVVAGRRLIGENLWIFVVGMFASAQMLLSMYAPLRIDHHGWQLALAAVLICAITDPQKVRSGITAGGATALSLAIGLDVLPYLALAGVTFVLRWVADASERDRLRAYGITIAVGTTLCYLVFASNANRLPRCDALTPVWLSVMVAAGALAFALSFISAQSHTARFGAAALGGAAICGWFFWSSPNCLSQTDWLTPELKSYWYDNVREVKPIYAQSVELISVMAFAAIAGLIGFIHALIQSRGTSRFVPWLSLFAMFVASCGLVFWQTRAGPALQLMTILPLAFLAAVYIPRIRNTQSVLRRVLGTVLAFALISGLIVQLGTAWFTRPANETKKAEARSANAVCATIPSIAPLAKQPTGTIFTFLDISPRLITLTKHSAIAGPYHRNGVAIVDVHRAFRDTPEGAEKAVRKYRSDYVLICPGSSESTLFKADAAKGFYMQLAANKSPAWLKRVDLPKGSPFMMWRVLPRR